MRAGRKILSRWLTALSRSYAGRDYAETGKQTKYSGPNKPFRHWLVSQKRYQGGGQEIDRPDCDLSPTYRGQPYFFSTHVVALKKWPRPTSGVE
jgi:hypothetical protein